jgi:sulfatase maturation enzyme AslB (radical SAM superfamily)
MRNPEWWSKLAQYNIEVIFAVDGFKGKHELYRKNTKFDKVIENLRAFISAGGTARVDSLVFKHNELDVDDLEKYLLNLGVEKVNFVSTTRFYEMEKYEVHDNNGNVEYYLEPAQIPKFKKTPSKSLISLLDKDFRNTAITNSTIEPKCIVENGIYVDPYGDIFPCCWLGGDYLEHPITEALPIHTLRNLSVQNTKDVLQKVGVPNCATGTLKSNNTLFKLLSEYWNGKDKCMTCARQCSKLIYDSNNKYE